MSGQRMVNVGLLSRLISCADSCARTYEHCGMAEESAAAANEARDLIDGPGVEPVAFHDKDQPEGIAWCPGYPEKLKDISPLYLAAPSAPVQMSDDALMRRANANCIGNNCSTGTEAVQMRWVFDLEALRDMMRSAPVQAVPDWQPIETAPKDEMILVYQPKLNRVTLSINDGFAYRYSTHWMPLPQPPNVCKTLDGMVLIPLPVTTQPPKEIGE